MSEGQNLKSGGGNEVGGRGVSCKYPRLGAHQPPSQGQQDLCAHIAGLGVLALLHHWDLEETQRERLQGGEGDGRDHRRAQFQSEEKAEKGWGRGPSCLVSL